MGFLKILVMIQNSIGISYIWKYQLGSESFVTQEVFPVYGNTSWVLNHSWLKRYFLYMEIPVGFWIFRDSRGISSIWKYQLSSESFMTQEVFPIYGNTSWVLNLSWLKRYFLYMEIPVGFWIFRDSRGISSIWKYQLSSESFVTQ